jgi:hypothetical protein
MGEALTDYTPRNDDYMLKYVRAKPTAYSPNKTKTYKRGNNYHPLSPCHGGTRLGNPQSYMLEFPRHAQSEYKQRRKLLWENKVESTGGLHTPPVSETARRLAIAATANHPQPRPQMRIAAQ